MTNDTGTVKEWKILKKNLSNNLKELIDNDSKYKETLKFMLHMLESDKTKFSKVRLNDNKST